MDARRVWYDSSKNHAEGMKHNITVQLCGQKVVGDRHRQYFTPFSGNTCKLPVAKKFCCAEWLLRTIDAQKTTLLTSLSMIYRKTQKPHILICPLKFYKCAHLRKILATLLMWMIYNDRMDEKKKHKCMVKKITKTIKWKLMQRRHAAISFIILQLIHDRAAISAVTSVLK